MASRNFTDRDGRPWRVWSTVPENRKSCLPGFADGWLTFECEPTGERGRLTPIPPGWESEPDGRLMLWARVAVVERHARLDAIRPADEADAPDVPDSMDTHGAVPERTARADAGS